MKIELVTGVTTFDSARNAISRINYKDFDTDYFVVVPDRFTLKAEELVFDTLGISSTFNINVVSLTGFASKVLKACDIEAQNAGLLEGTLVVKRIIEEKNKDLKCYKKSSPSFCYEILKNILQIKSSGLKPEDLIYEGKNSFLKDKIHDLQIIYLGYEQLNENKMDSTDLLNVCADVLLSEKKLKNSVVMMLGFDSFTQANYNLIASLAKACEKVVISVPQKISDGNAYIFDDDILQKIKKLAQEQSLEISVISPKPALNEKQVAVAQNAFSRIYKKQKHDYLTVFCATDSRDEVENIASYIKTKVFNGERYKNFCVSCSNLDKYKNLIEEVFTECEIPYYMDLSQTMENSLLVNYIKKFFHLKQKNFLKDDLLYLLGTPLFEKENKQDLITLINEKEIEGRGGFLKYLSKELDGIYGIVEKIDTASVFGDYVQIVKDIVELCSANFDFYLGSLEKNGRLKERSIEQQIPEKIEEFLGSFNKEEKFSLNEFLEFLDLFVSISQVSALPSFCDSVFVGDMTSSYFSEIDNFVVLGASSGSLPVVIEDNGLISDGELDSLELKSKIEPSIKMINRRNRFKVYNNLILGRKSLIVSYPSVGDGGNKQEKAMFVETLLNVFEQEEVITSDFKYLRDKKFDVFAYLLRGAKNVAKRKLMEFLKDKEVPREFTGSLQEYLKCDFEKYELNREKLNLSNLEQIYFPKNTFSVSEIERFFDCPFKHFVDYGLKLRVKPSAKIEKNELGTIYHDMLEKFVNHFSEDLGFVKDEEIAKFVEKNLASFINIDKLEFAQDRDLILETLKKDCIKIAKKVVKLAKVSKFKPEETEKRIFREYKFKERLISLKGKIDRIDKYKNEFVIIDYKTGSLSDDMFSELYYGQKIQLFMYSNALKQNENMEPCGVFYFNASPKYEKASSSILKGIACDNLNEKVEEGSLEQNKEGKIGIDSKKVSKQLLTKMENYAVALSEKAVDQICKGTVCARPKDDSCKYCKYRGICLFQKYEAHRECPKVDKSFFEEVRDE